MTLQRTLQTIRSQSKNEPLSYFRDILFFDNDGATDSSK
ncbi:MAG: hypothetical protein RL642_1000, partial [Bacteroidota bacterium]